MVYVIQVCWELARKLSVNLYDTYHCCVCSKKAPDDGQRNCPKHVGFYSKNKFEKLMHLVGFIIRMCVCVCVFIQSVSLARDPKLLSMYTVEQRGFLVSKYWQTGSFKACQTAFRTEFGERRAPSKFSIQKLVKKLETRGSRSNACRLLSLGPVEGQSVKNAPRTIEQHKDAIRQEIQAVNVNTLGKVFQNLKKRIQVCLDMKRDLFQHRLWVGPVLYRFRYVYINFQVIISIT